MLRRARRDDPAFADDATSASSIGDVARRLRRERTRQGLRLEDASARTGLPVSRLRVLESAVVDRVPDQLGTLRALRHYADFLGLPGDRFALTVLEHWPSRSIAVGPPAAGGALPGTRPPPSAPPAAGTTVVAVPVPPQPTGAGSPGETATTYARPSEPSAGGLRAGPGAAPPTAGGTLEVPLLPHGLEDTGPIGPVRGAGERPYGERAAPAPLGLRLAVWAVGIAVAVGIAGLVIDGTEPGWLQSLGVEHVTAAPGGGTGTRVGGNPPPGSAPTTTAPSVARPSVTQGSTTPSSATFTVAATSFVLDVVVGTGESWVQVTGPTSSTPLFSGLLTAGQSRSFTVTRSITVDVGSVAGHVTLKVGSTDLRTIVPPAAPYTMSFRSAA